MICATGNTAAPKICKRGHWISITVPVFTQHSMTSRLMLSIYPPNWFTMLPKVEVSQQQVPIFECPIWVLFEWESKEGLLWKTNSHRNWCLMSLYIYDSGLSLLERSVSWLNASLGWWMTSLQTGKMYVARYVELLGVISDHQWCHGPFGLVQANFWTLNLGPGSAILDWTSALFGDSSGNITFCRTWFQVQFNQFLNFEPDFSQVHQGSGLNCGITIYNTALLVGEVHFSWKYVYWLVKN